MKDWSLWGYTGCAHVLPSPALVAPVSCRGAQWSENVHDLRLEEPLVETEEFHVQMMSYAAGWASRWQATWHLLNRKRVLVTRILDGVFFWKIQGNWTIQLLQGFRHLHGRHSKRRDSVSASTAPPQSDFSLGKWKGSQEFGDLQRRRLKQLSNDSKAFLKKSIEWVLMWSS